MKLLAGLLGSALDDDEDDEDTSAPQGLLSSPVVRQGIATGLLGYDGTAQQAPATDAGPDDARDAGAAFPVPFNPLATLQGILGPNYFIDGNADMQERQRDPLAASLGGSPGAPTLSLSDDELARENYLLRDKAVMRRVGLEKQLAPSATDKPVSIPQQAPTPTSPASAQASQGEGYVDNYTAPAKLREIGFALRHPDAAMAIGTAEPGQGSRNISTVATRFGASIGLKETPSHEGSQVNAFRHALWQAMIARDFGKPIAAEVGNAHEENPYALNRQTLDGPLRFPSLSAADESIDLLNNRAGRSLGLAAPGVSNSRLALQVLDRFKDTGLWVAAEQPDGTYAATQAKLPVEQYEAALKKLVPRNDDGFAPQEWKALEQQRRHFIEDARLRIMREPKL